MFRSTITRSGFFSLNSRSPFSPVFAVNTSHFDSRTDAIISRRSGSSSMIKTRGFREILEVINLSQGRNIFLSKFRGETSGFKAEWESICGCLFSLLYTFFFFGKAEGGPALTKIFSSDFRRSSGNKSFILA